MLVQTTKESTHCLDVSRRVGIEDNHIVEVGRHLFQALHNLVYNLEPPGRSAAALGRDEPLLEARGSSNTP